jgi:hypothetical protein
MEPVALRQVGPAVGLLSSFDFYVCPAANASKLAVPNRVAISVMLAVDFSPQFYPFKSRVVA